jgi:hypothetical protein
MASVEVLAGPERRRRWSLEQKRAIVAAAFKPGDDMADLEARGIPTVGVATTEFIQGAEARANALGPIPPWCSSLIRSRTVPMMNYGGWRTNTSMRF